MATEVAATTGTGPAIDPNTGELFDPSPYQIPFPKTDGHEITDLALKLAGTLKLNRNDPEHTALVAGLNLGRILTLQIEASVDGKNVSIREDQDGNQTVTHTVALRLHSVNEHE